MHTMTHQQDYNREYLQLVFKILQSFPIHRYKIMVLIFMLILMLFLVMECKPVL